MSHQTHYRSHWGQVSQRSLRKTIRTAGAALFQVKYISHVIAQQCQSSDDTTSTSYTNNGKLLIGTPPPEKCIFVKCCL